MSIAVCTCMGVVGLCDSCVTYECVQVDSVFYGGWGTGLCGSNLQITHYMGVICVSLNLVHQCQCVMVLSISHATEENYKYRPTYRYSHTYVYIRYTHIHSMYCMRNTCSSPANGPPLRNTYIRYIDVHVHSF